MQPVTERISHDLESLATMTDTSMPGWTRAAFSELDIVGRHWAADQLRAEGLEVHEDAAGNIIGRLPGRHPELGAIATGSHTDTVEGGGRFDGIVGVIGALEAVRMLRENDIRLNHDLLIIVFFNEEPNSWGTSCLGSRALTGALPKDYFDRENQQGEKLGHALQRVGIDPSGMLGVDAYLQASNLRSFVELHVEQGPVLERVGSQVGIVTSITGVTRFEALFRGRQDHAGTTSMLDRRDAGCTAAGVVLAVERIAGAHETGRGTTGQVLFTPDAVNVVSEEALITGEFRSPDDEWLSFAQDQLQEAAAAEGAKRRVDVAIDWLPTQAPVPMAEPLQQAIEATSAHLDLTASKLYSGAEHDAAIMGALVPSAMIFIPSAAGRSHCPDEWTDLADISAGTAMLAGSLVEIDRLR
ncbi:hydantoinase/carbamoylase family amidase [Leucobacter sp. gxy201]|uniref:M20 family metallo-hydrolase n=1 Tax=Leucobacter sp. gxy201 TaxID=2957200 RepID=UPI003DA07F8E